MDQIPSLSPIVARLIAIVNSSASSAEDAAKLIENDPALTSKVLRLANSAFYGIPRSVASVQSAVVILGFNTLKSIVLSASVMRLFPQQKTSIGFDKIRFWRHSIICALVAKILAENIFHTISIDPQSAFCSGIMHDIGKLIFDLFMPKEYAGVCERSRKNKTPLAQTEVDSMGIDHADLGRILSDKWALPIDLEYAIVFHHRPQAANKLRELVTLVHMADAITHRIKCGLWDDEAPFPEWKEARKILSIDDTRYQHIVDLSADEIEKYQEFLAIIAG